MNKLKYALVAIVAMVTPMAASANVQGTLGTNAALPILALTTTGLSGGSVATFGGGTVYSVSYPNFAAMPVGTVGNFLAAGPQLGTPATLTFATSVRYLSFLWGSPDTYNTLTVTSTAGTFTFTTATMGFSVSNGDQGFAQSVQFTAMGAGEQILSAQFISTTNAFEAANFRVTGAPGPIAGAGIPALTALGGLLWLRRRRAA